MNLFAILLAAAGLLQSEEAEGNLPPKRQLCTKEFKAVEMVPPKLVGHHHLYFEGEALVEAWITPGGNVEKAIVISSDWKMLRGGKAEGVNELVLSAILKWRYPKTKNGCTAEVPIKIEFVEE